MANQKTVTFEEEVDDSFQIMIKQETGEFIIVHNNKLKCKCMFCVFYNSVNQND